MIPLISFIHMSSPSDTNTINISIWAAQERLQIVALQIGQHQFPTLPFSYTDQVEFFWPFLFTSSHMFPIQRTWSSCSYNEIIGMFVFHIILDMFIQFHVAMIVSIQVESQIVDTCYCCW